MTCIVITRNGRGEPYKFRTKEAARLHPMVQESDIVASDANEFCAQFHRNEEDLILRFFEGRDRARVIDALETWKGTPRRGEIDIDVRILIWNSVVRAASPPPTEPEVLVALIAEDRRAMESTPYRSRSVQQPEAEIPRKVKGTSMSEEAVEKKTRAPRLPEDAVVKILVESNPKREGTSSYIRFEAYKDGMTVKEAKAAGVKAADLTYDIEKGYISVEAAA